MCVWVVDHVHACCPVCCAESVGVGVLLKNPLKGVPLLLTNLCLVWDDTPTSGHTTTSADAASPAAVCEVVRQVTLLPEQEKMVSGCACGCDRS